MVWVIRLLLLAVGSLVAMFVARDAANFGLIETLVTMVVIFVLVAGAGWWMRRWKV